VTHLRKMMLEELQRRNYSQTTTRAYLRAVAGFAKHFGKPPDQLGPDEIRRYQAHLIEERRIGVRTAGCVAVLLRQDAETSVCDRRSAVSETAAPSADCAESG